MASLDTTPLPAVVDGRFEVGPLVGEGGMATVYRAHDTSTGATVAIKVLREDIMTGAARERFAREVALTGHMAHPGILEIISAGAVNDRPYYAMPFIAGRTLQHRLAGEPALPIREAVEIAARVAEALDYAHARGVIHRDIKPANILLDGDQPMLADFGIARALDMATGDRLTESGFAVGTAQYMSPEQAASDTLDGRSDIYSLGCVVYEMLIGTPPFVGATRQQVLARHAASPIPGLRDVRATIPLALEQVVQRALQKIPADRFATAGEFATALRSAGAARVEHDPRWRRRAAPRAAIAAGIVIAAAATVFALRQRGPGLDPNRVLVLPLVVGNAAAGGPSDGEDAATMLGAAVDGAGSLRWVDGWRLLDTAQRGNIATLTMPATRALARQSRSRYVLTGRVAAAGKDSLEAVLELFDAAGDTVVARSSGSAPRGEAWRAALRAVNGVLPKLIGTEAPDASAGWQERSPRAIASYLRGEAAYRRLEMPRALALFRDAVRDDSLLTLAALRGAQAASWNHAAGEAGELARLALRQPLSERDAHFARGVAAFVDGDADSSTRELGRAIALDSTMSMAWVQLGETLTHLLPHAGSLDSLTGVALERAYALDSTAAPAAYHLAERAARAGDANRTAALLKIIRTDASDTLASRQIELMHRCVSSSDRRIDWSSDARVRPLPLLVAATKLAAGGMQLACAASGFDAILSVDTSASGDAEGRRFAALLGIVGVRQAIGQPDSATAAIDRFAARWGAGSSLIVRQALVDAAAADRARAIARADSARWGADFARSAFSNRLWLLGVWSAHDGRLDAAAGAARVLSRRADSTRRTREARYAQSVLAHAAIAAGDTARALSLLKPLVGAPTSSDELQWNESVSMADERLLLARLLLSRGDAAGALAVANVFDSTQPAVFLLYLAPSLELRARAADMLGGGPPAARFKSRVAAIRARATQIP